MKIVSRLKTIPRLHYLGTQLPPPPTTRAFFAKRNGKLNPIQPNRKQNQLLKQLKKMRRNNQNELNAPSEPGSHPNVVDSNKTRGSPLSLRTMHSTSWK